MDCECVVNRDLQLRRDSCKRLRERGGTGEYFDDERQRRWRDGGRGDTELYAKVSRGDCSASAKRRISSCGGERSADDSGYDWSSRRRAGNSRLDQLRSVVRVVDDGGDVIDLGVVQGELRKKLRCPALEIGDFEIECGTVCTLVYPRGLHIDQEAAIGPASPA